MKATTCDCGTVNTSAAASTNYQPGQILWGLYPTHDRGDQWHPAIVLRVVKESSRTVITAALGTSRRVSDDHGPTEFVCYEGEEDFELTGLRASTRFNMAGLRFSFVAGTKKEKVIGEINETATPTLYRRLILACMSATL